MPPLGLMQKNHVFLSKLWPGGPLMTDLGSDLVMGNSLFFLYHFFPWHGDDSNNDN